MTKKHIQKSCRRLLKQSFSARGYGEQRLLFDNKNSIRRILRLKIQALGACSTSLYTEIISFENYKKLNFWWNFKVSIWADFAKILAILGTFWQFWSQFATLTMAKSLPEVWLNSLKRSHS